MNNAQDVIASIRSLQSALEKLGSRTKLSEQEIITLNSALGGLTIGMEEIRQKTDSIAYGGFTAAFKNEIRATEELRIKIGQLTNAYVTLDKERRQAAQAQYETGTAGGWGSPATTRPVNYASAASMARQTMQAEYEMASGANWGTRGALSELDPAIKGTEIPLVDFGNKVVRLTGDAEVMSRAFTKQEALMEALSKAYAKLEADVVAAGGTLGTNITGTVTETGVALRGTMGKNVTGQKVGLSAPTGIVSAPLNLQSEAQIAAAEAQSMSLTKLKNNFVTMSGSAESAVKTLGKYGFALDDIVKVQTEASTGLQKYSLRHADANGEIRNGTVVLDKYGNVLSDTTTRYKGFTDMIIRNIAKVAEWAVAVGLIYGSIAKLQQSFQDLKELSDVLADISVTTGESGAQLTRYFDAIAGISQKTATPIRDVASTFDEALKFTSEVADSDERLAKASEVVSQAMIIQKLTGITVKDAMELITSSQEQARDEFDQFSGAVKDSGRALDNHASLVDRWVTVAKNANTNVAELAQGFSKTAEAAFEAGLSADKLNGILGALLQTTSMSGEEAGVVVRSIITTLTSNQQAVAALAKYGITVKDAAGNLKDAWEILREISALQKTGVLSPTAMREISGSMGGARRGPQFLQLMSAFDKAWSLEQTSRLSEVGIGEDALGLKTKTLAGSVTKLDNAFVVLVQTLGTHGLLDVLVNSTTLVTQLISGMSDLTNKTGDFSYKLLEAVTTLALFANILPRMRNMAGPGLAYSTGMLGVDKAKLLAISKAEQETLEARQLGKIGPTESIAPQNIMVMGSMKRAMTSAALPVALTVAETIMREGFNQQAGMEAGGAIAGGIIGALVSSGNPMGAMIGAQMGSAFMASVDISKLKPPEDLTGEQIDKNFAEARNALISGARKGQLPGQGGTLLDMLGITEHTTKTDAEKIVKDFNAKLRAANYDISKLGFTGAGGRTGYTGYAQLYSKYLEEMDKRGITPKAEKEANVAEIVQETEMRRKRWADEVQKALAGGVSKEFQTEKTGALSKLNLGELSNKEVKAIIEGNAQAIQSADVVLTQLSYDSKNAGMDVGEFLKTFSDIPEASRTEIIDLANQASELRRKMGELDSGSADYSNTASQLAEVVDLLGASIRGAGEEMEIAKFKFQGFSKSTLGVSQLQQAAEKSRGYYSAYAKEAGVEEARIRNEEMDQYFWSEQDKKFIKVKIIPTFMELETEDLEEIQKKIEKAASSFNIERLKNVSAGRFGELANRVKYWQQFLQSIPGFNEQPETFNFVLGDKGELRSLRSVASAVRYALEDLNETEKKQLEGQWNIPTGATVMVPLNSLDYLNKAAMGNMLPGGESLMTGAGATGQIADYTQQTANNTAGMLNWMQNGGLGYGTTPEYKAPVPYGMKEDLGYGVDTSNPKIPYGMKTNLGYGMDTSGPKYHEGVSPMPSSFSEPIVSALSTSNSELKSMSSNLTQSFSSMIAALNGLAARSNIIQNSVYLDGQVIARYVSRSFSNNLSSAASARGSIGSVV
jgi:TP901 family phage tail tape measure protein